MIAIVFNNCLCLKHNVFGKTIDLDFFVLLL